MGAPGRGEAAVQRVGGLEFFDGWAGGNSGEVSSSDGKEFEIRLRPDTGSPRHRLWFHFRVRGAACAGRVILSIVNMSKQRSLFKDAGISPATRRSEGAGSGASPRPWGAWGRVPPKDCYFYRSHRHGGGWKLSFVVTFETDFDEREFAYSFPYPYREGLLPWLPARTRRPPLLPAGAALPHPAGSPGRPCHHSRATARLEPPAPAGRPGGSPSAGRLRDCAGAPRRDAREPRYARPDGVPALGGPRRPTAPAARRLRVRADAQP